MEKISVAVRFRPSTAHDCPGERHWRVEDNRISLHRPLGTPICGVSFAFDHVFDQTCTNAAVYGVVAKSVIDAAVSGFNGTAFAYGQTSSGKTYTMNGSEDDPGIIQLAVNDVFRSIQMIEEREFLIRVSYMEIYNEEINDLLSLENQKLQIHESLERGIFVAGLREEIVNSAEQVFKLIKLGEANRHFGETNMNVRSSRSHTIFRMVIESSAKDTLSSDDLSKADAIRVSVLNLVDLAGSERIAKTGAGGVRLKEGKHINKSLMALGNVINKLSDSGKQRGHIPYRDSKLTRILQPALGGNAKTSIICTVAPEELHIEETRGTLQFASRAKRITNCAQVNEILTDAALLKRQKLEIEELRRKLQGSHSELLEQVVLKQRNDMLKSELEREKLAMELKEERKSRETLEHRIMEQQMKIDALNYSCFSDLARNSAQQSLSTRQNYIETYDGCNTMLESDSFKTPNPKAKQNEFVAKRSGYLSLPDTSPIPEAFVNIADEDMWLQLNKGCTTDLSMLQMTPTMETQSLPSGDTSLMSFPEEGTATATENLNLEPEGIIGKKNIEETQEKCAVLERECDVLREEKKYLSQVLSSSEESVKLLTTEKEELLSRLNTEKQNMEDLEEEISVEKKILEATSEKCAILTRECDILREEKSSLSQTLLKCEENVKLLTTDKEELMIELNTEKQKMEDLKEVIKQFSLAFTHREGQIKSLYTRSKAMAENLKAHSAVIPETVQF